MVMGAIESLPIRAMQYNAQRLLYHAAIRPLPSPLISPRSFAASRRTSWTRTNGRTDRLRIVRGDNDARLLRGGGPKPLVHPGLRRRLRAWFGLRIFAGRLAVRSGRSDLVGRGAASLARPGVVPGCRPD